MSGETCRPYGSRSSPTFPITVTSAGATRRTRPCRKRAAPTPPASTATRGPASGATRHRRPRQRLAPLGEPDRGAVQQRDHHPDDGEADELHPGDRRVEEDVVDDESGRREG